MTRATRAALAFVAVTLTGGFAVAATLNAHPDGLGTHEQLGLPPCAIRTLTGSPCPGCGLTTSITHVAHGRVLTAWRAQPVGVFIAAASLIAIVVCGEAAIRGRWRLPIDPLATAVVAVWTVNAVMLGRWLMS